MRRHCVMRPIAFIFLQKKSPCLSPSMTHLTVLDGETNISRDHNESDSLILNIQNNSDKGCVTIFSTIPFVYKPRHERGIMKVASFSSEFKKRQKF